MTMEDVAIAEARVAEARARLNGTVHTLQAHLDPQLLADKAKQNMMQGGTRAAIASAKAVDRNPRVAMAALGLVAVLLLRRPVARLFSRKPRARAAARPAYPRKDARS